jgi:predicted DNA-binding transcriptional regulator AlpA
MNTEAYLTAEQLLQFSTFSLYRMVRGGYGPPAIHVGRALRFSRQALDDRAAPGGAS